MIFDIVGDLLAYGRQLKQLVLDDRIVGLLGALPVNDRLIPEIVRPIHADTIPHLRRASFVSFQLPPSPMVILAGWIEDPLDVSVQRPQFWGTKNVSTRPGPKSDMSFLWPK